MLLILPILSFICAGLLTVFLIVLFRRPTVNTSNVSLVLWLIFGNVVHVVNAIVWSSNVEHRIPVWCDIVTKLLVGANIALPGVCLCSARYLELLASSRKLYPNTYSKRVHMLIDVALCYVLPFLYMTLHFAVQDHRFDLLQDFGCSASIHRSTPAVLIMVIPPLIFCSITLVLCMFSVWHCTRLSSERFTSHLSARSSISVPLFIRRLTKSIILTTTVLIVTLFPLLSPRPESWASFHANWDVIFVIQIASEVTGAQIVWWCIPVVSLVYLLLSVVLGDETADVVSWMRRRFTGSAPVQRSARPELRLLTLTHPMASKSSLVAPSLSAPQAVQLRSGWDDMLDVKKGRRGVLPNRKSVVSSSDSSESSLSSNPSPSPTTPEDDAFTSSTLTYLASPAAQTLGLARPVTPPTPTLPYAKPPRAPTAHLLPPQQPIPEDTASTISSIWDAPWPVPPPITPPRGLRRALSRPQSPALSDTGPAYPMYSPMEPPTPPPFEGSSVPGRGPLHRDQVPRKSAMKKSVRRTWSREALARGYAASDVVYMTRTVEELA
ncbi:pheromone A receptor-domain-containing protein [Mycena maculata]|uniref:Pheromone A receptor-domain-containing protein n=1 Tax=Mycena maculata TaxID=230809 RepID=A0AAD7N200_9AGAR|nr:pheromone A receptor-domain-containing protein [Mycena maculata]